jgi:carboxypeptidase family protein
VRPEDVDGAAQTNGCEGNGCKHRPEQPHQGQFESPCAISQGLRKTGQLGTGLTGVITDQSNAVVPNADVEIKDTVKGTTQSTKTDREGVYLFFFLAPISFYGSATYLLLRELITAFVRHPLGYFGLLNDTDSASFFSRFPPITTAEARRTLQLFA